MTRSRVEPTRALVEASRRLAEPVPVWLQSSTLAIYGDAGERELDETAPPADGPPQMAGVATAWEAALEGANATRSVVLRTGIVLDNDSPALDRLRSLARWGLGDRVGTGRQWVGWIHIDDWPTPGVAVRLGALMLRTDPALALTGPRAMPSRLLEAGFTFDHPDLDEALADLTRRR